MAKKTISIIGVKGYPYVYGGYETFVKQISERLIKNYNIISNNDIDLFKSTNTLHQNYMILPNQLL